MASDKTIEPDIPRIPVKIVRVGDKVKISIGKYSITLLPLPNKSQTYDLVSLEQFITRVAQIKYEELIKREQTKQQIRDAFLGTAQEANEQEMISKLLDERENGSKKA